MFDIVTKQMEWGGRTLKLETGKIARQADGAVMASYGDTVVLATAVGAKSPKPGQDFFPLTVNYQERYYATGRIPGGFFKREARPSERETLTKRARESSGVPIALGTIEQLRQLGRAFDVAWPEGRKGQS